jgi:DNA-directed RNA polymerase specialized sigma24 family protein
MRSIPSPKRDAVADYLSQEWSFEQIAEHMGITVKAVSRHFERICKGLGKQAQ